MAGKIRMALIGSYPKLAEIFLNLTDGREDIISYNVYASFEEAARTARNMEDSLDVILSRGGTAEYIRRAVHIPVLSIPITPFDVIKAIHSLDPLPGKIALIHYQKNIRDVQAVARMFGIEIQEYSFSSQEDIQLAVKDAIRRGIKTVIGGHVGVLAASSAGLNAIELSAGEEAMDRVLDESIALLSQIRREQMQTTRIRSALNSLVEGIVVSDDKKRIVMINKTASDLFQRRYHKGDAIGSEILTNECLAAYETREEQPVYIQKIRKETYSVTHTPILRGKVFLGIVSRYENITKTEALEQKIRREIRSRGFDAQYHFADIITKDPKFTIIKKEAEIYAKTESSILIQGESGTGKELFAQSIHNSSPRKNGPFVAVNCAAIPSTLLESELFGYEAGAFTGARKDGRAGFFEMAHLGTLFLDEIGEVSMEVQARLLRVLQEHEIMRVGGDKIIPINVRVISATNKDLKEEIRKGNFREDLYYRLNILTLKIPPLRQRMGDLPILVSHFSSQYSCTDRELQDLIQELNRHSWPGNIRELRNTIERYGVLLPFLRSGSISRKTLLDMLDLKANSPEESLESHPLPEAVPKDELSSGQSFQIKIPLGHSLSDIVAHVEYLVCQEYLRQYDHDQELAANALGIGRTTLWRKSRMDPFTVTDPM